MKSLLIVRHAKSSWDITSADDFDRPLNERGKTDAPEMAKRLIKEKIKIDAFISSPAKRAKKTAQLFVHEFQRSKDDIIFIPELYNVSSSVLYQVSSTLDDDYSTVAIFSHNPAVTDFANSLTTHRIDDMPTCGIFAVKIHAGKWEDFENAQKEFWFFNYPKLKGGISE
ncbi:MAG: histidine phosphatase family protein [Chitinophagaceae bacterium]